MTGVDPDEWRVLVIRAWRERHGLRIRVLVEGEPRRWWVLSNPVQAAALVQALLTGLEPDGEQDDGRHDIEL